MKKLLVLAVIAGGIWYFTQGKDASGEALELEEDFFTKYNNRIVVDSLGRWMLVKDGKLAATRSTETIIAHQQKYPEFAEVINLDWDVWGYYAGLGDDYFDNSGKNI